MAVLETKGLWHLSETVGKRRWSTLVSDLTAMPRQRRCPSCGLGIKFGFATGELAPVKDKENDITHWTGRCGCGMELIIFND